MQVEKDYEEHLMGLQAQPVEQTELESYSLDNS